MKRRIGFEIKGSGKFKYFVNCPMFGMDHAKRVRHWRFVMGCSWSMVGQLFSEYYGVELGESIMHYSGQRLMGLNHTLGHRLTTLGIEMLKDREWLNKEQS